MKHFRTLLFRTLPLLALSIAGCWSDDEPRVVVYTALDQEFSAVMFEEYKQQTGVRVDVRYDTESTKSVGLAERIIAEADLPRCDVHWNNEILHTLRLEKLGLLQPYHSPRAEEYPAEYRSPDGYWYGFAARARILIVNTDLVSVEERPTSIYDLGSEKWRGRTGIAKPLFGTTATHAACLFAKLGEQRAKEFFHGLKANNVRILGGNRHVAREVAVGKLAFGLTDTDDAMVEIEAGSPVVIVYPDQHDDGLGTLFIPNTLAIIKDCPHVDEARRLIDHLLSAEVESALAAGRSAQIPLGKNAKPQTRVKTPAEVKAMSVDFYQAAEQWETARRFIADEFTAP
jgi:iron(III) transport system substrate-binding protein